MRWILEYDLAEDYLERRGPVEADHLVLAHQASDRGELLLGGDVGDPRERTVLIFEAPDPTTAEAFAAADPYVSEGLVVSWRVRRISYEAGI